MRRQHFAKPPRFRDDNYETVLDPEDQAILVGDMWNLRDLLASLKPGRPVTAAQLAQLEQVALHLCLLWICDDAIDAANAQREAGATPGQEPDPLAEQKRIDATVRALLADLDLGDD